MVVGGCRTWAGSPTRVRHDLGFPWILTYGLGSLREGVWIHLNVGVGFGVPNRGGLDPWDSGTHGLGSLMGCEESLRSPRRVGRGLWSRAAVEHVLGPQRR